MARDILSEYGNDSGAGDKPRATNGGVMPVRDVMNYAPPQGPKHMMDSGPGLHADNCGNCGSQGYTGETHKETSGSPGLHGTNRGMGTNRKG